MLIALFDVDGTLSDSAQVITDSVNATIAQLGLPLQTQEQLRRWVGPPLASSFSDFAGLAPAEIEPAIATYRKHYQEVMFDAPLFAGVVPMLEALAHAGVVMATATSKMERIANPIIARYGITHFFRVLAGSQVDSADHTKASVIELALRRLRDAGVDVDDSTKVMIGDRFYDIEGGNACGLDTIGVTWSGTSPDEFAKANHVVNSPEELTRLLLTLDK